MKALFWTPGDSATEITLYQSGVSETQFLSDDEGWDNPPDKAIIQATTDAYEEYDAGVGFEARVYVARFQLVSPALDSLIRTWNQNLLAARGVGTLRHVAEDGVTRYLRARPQRGQWGQRKGDGAQVAQSWIAANPWWYGAAETASGTFNADTPVAIACTNNGWLSARPWFLITGVVHTPKITNAVGEVIEINKATVNADDILLIDCRLGNPKATYWAHGTGYPTVASGVSWSNWRTNATMFWRLAASTSNVTIQGATGQTSTATCVASWTPLYGSL